MPRPALVKTSRWVAPLVGEASVVEDQDEIAKKSALTSALIGCIDVLKPNSMYFLEITENIEKASLHTIFDTYHVTVRVWEKQDDTTNHHKGERRIAI